MENGYCRVRIPNRELEQVFVRDIQGKINAGMEHGADDLKQLADAALGQIDRKDYAAALRAEGVADIVKIGLAYRRKRVELAVG